MGRAATLRRGLTAAEAERPALRRRLPLQGSLNRCEQIVAGYRLSQRRHNAALTVAYEGFCGIIGGENDRRNVHSGPDKMTMKLESTEIRHMGVQQETVGTRRSTLEPRDELHTRRVDGSSQA